MQSAYYQKLIALRKKYQVIVDGKYATFNAEDSAVYGFTRTNEKQELVVICSFSEDKVNYEIPNDLIGGQLLLGNYNDTDLKLREQITLRPYEAAVYFRENK